MNDGGSTATRASAWTEPLDIRNRVVLALRPVAQEFLRSRFTTRPMKAGEVLCRQGEPFTHAIFPHDGVISLLSHMQDGRTAEMSSVGNEGFLGFGFLMGVDVADCTCAVFVPGYASWLSVADLREAMDDFVCVRETMLRYARSLIAQLMETVACYSLHSAEQRIARLLLHTRDRMSGDRFELTQQSLSDALGVRRATAGAVCAGFRDAGAIRYSRGSLTVADRDALEGFACECYRKIRASTLV